MSNLKLVSVLDNFILPDYSLQILLHIKSFKDSTWSSMNQEDINGPFWNNKRLMIDSSICSFLAEKITETVGKDFEYTAINKAQRFFAGDVLGPLADGQHVPSIKYGITLFLEDCDGGIDLIDSNKKISSKAGTLVVHPSIEQYKIYGPSTGVMHFMTFFANLQLK